MRTSIITVVAVLMLGSFGLLCYCAFQLLDLGEQPAPVVDPKLARISGKLYVSADGLKKVIVEPDGRATLTFGDHSIKIQALPGMPEQGLIEDLKKALGAKQTYLFEEVEGGLKDPEGTVLYTNKAQALKVVKAMVNIRDLASFYYSRSRHRYPRKRSDLTDLGPEITIENPLGQSMKPVFLHHEFEKHEGDVAFQETLEKLSDGKAIFKQDGKPGVPPGLIECLSLMPFDESHAEEGISFFVRAYDGSGKFITSSLADKVFVLAQKNGVDHQVVKSEDVKSTITKPSKAFAYFKLLPAPTD